MARTLFLLLFLSIVGDQGNISRCFAARWTTKVQVFPVGALLYWEGVFRIKFHQVSNAWVLGEGRKTRKGGEMV
jgi:hypothetical protein